MGFLTLVLSFLKIGAVSFGGGWTVVGIIRGEILGNGWLDERGFAELIATAQITPGPIALNAATLVGWKLYGIGGAVAATFSVIAVPVAAMVVSLRLAAKAPRGPDSWGEALKSGTMALMAMTFWQFAPDAVSSVPGAIIGAATFALSLFTKVPPLAIIFGAGFLRMALGFLPGF